MNCSNYLMILVITLPIFCQTKSPSARVQEKIQQIEKGDDRTILDLGTLGDRSAVPYLQKLRRNPDGGFWGNASISAQMALAKLGDEKAKEQILAEASSDDNPALQVHAVGELAYLGGKDVIRILIGLLAMDKERFGKGFDPNRRDPNGEHPIDVVIYDPLNLNAMRALTQIVSNPPVDPKAEPKQADVPLWRKWYEAHKDDHHNDQP